jgi:CHAT domain-containing protein/Flp pilus assembly protein TadD
MKKLMAVGFLIVLPVASFGQELPKVTEEGKRAAMALIEACKKAGALKAVTDPRTKAERMVVADEMRLKEVVQQQSQKYTPALRDALLAFHDHPGVVAVLLRLGQEAGDDQALAVGRFYSAKVLAEELKYQEARQGYEQAASLFEQLKLREWEATSLNNLATVCYAQEDLVQARKLGQQALDLRKQLFGERHPAVANSLNNLAVVCHAQGDLVQARKLSQQALDLRKQLFGERHPDVAASLDTLAEVCRARGDLGQARKHAQQALDLMRQFFGERHPDVATALDTLAEVCHDQGDLVQARRLHEQALDLMRQFFGERHRNVAKSLNNLANVCHDQGDLPQARKLHEQALDLRKQLFGERHPAVATSLNNLGAVCHAQGDLVQARRLYEQALDLRKQLFGERHPDMATSLDNLAMVCKEQGDLPQARKLGQQALNLRKQLFGERHPDVATSLGNLAMVCKEQGDLPQARKLGQQALDLFKQLFGERHPAVATSLNNLANVCHAQGDLVQARRLHEQALDLRKQLFGERHPDVALSLNNLATVFGDQRDLPQAVWYSTAAVLASRLPPVDRVTLADLHADDLTCDANTVRQLELLGMYLPFSTQRSERSSYRQAAKAYALAAALLDRLRGNVIQTEESKLVQGAELSGIISARVRLAANLFVLDGKAEDLHTAFTAIEQGSARVFLEALARARSYQVGGVPEGRQQEERDLLSHIRGIDGRIQRENARTLDKRNADLVAKLYEELKQKRADLDEFTAQLRTDYPQYAALQYPKPCTLAQARDCLAANEVAVLFALHRKGSSAVIVQKTPAPGDKGEGVAVVWLPGSDVLGSKVRTLVDAEVLKSDSRCRELGAELFDLLLKPLAPYIQGKDLVLVPDGALWELPFELLVEGRTAERDGRYLIETRQLRYTPRMTVLHLTGLWEQTRKAPPEPLWALADPVFSKDDSRAKGDLHAATQNLLARYALRHGSRNVTWQRLPATRAEVQAIADLYHVPEDDVVKDTLANEKVLKTASKDGILARKRYIHLATHGLLGVGLGRPPSLVLSLVGNDGQEQLGGPNDGFLTMQEVTHLKLNADLVVLSACETGKGDLRPAEGVQGLARSFLYAGSRGVVCSLWSVEDVRTARLMEALYRRLQEGKPSAEALALARRQLIAEEQAPFYWAPFILIGK